MFHKVERRDTDKELFPWATRLVNDLRNNGKEFTAQYFGWGEFNLKECPNITRDGKNLIFCIDVTSKHTKKRIVAEIEKNENNELLWVGAEKDPFDHPRIKCVFWPADMLVLNEEYKNFDNIEKGPSPHKHWISLNLLIRPHRIYMASVLKGLNLDQKGDLRIQTFQEQPHGEPPHIVSQGNPDLQSYVKNNWRLKEELEKISTESSKGYQELITREWWGSALFLYKDIHALGEIQGNSWANFDKNLRHLYKDKTLEVVNESVHGYNPVCPNEKWLNAVVGLNLIVINGPANTVRLLEQLGWNSCRNVINHDYDSIVNPVERCEQAIRLNYRLFNDSAYCNKVWKDNFETLKDNSKWARLFLCSKILKSCEEEVKKVA